MKLDKISNYNVDLEKVRNEIEIEKSNRFVNRKLIDRNESLINEFEILKHMNEDENIKSMTYIKDFSYEKTIRVLNEDEYIQNEMNTYGCDMVVNYKDRTEIVDLKVLSYKPKYYHENRKGKIYHGWSNKKYGVDNLTFQLYQQAKSRKSYVSDEEGNNTKYGWGYNYYKNTSELYMMIQGVGLYIIKYKALVELMKGYMHRGYDRHYFDMKKEIVISIPCEDMSELFENGIIKYISMKPIRRIRQRLI